MLLVLRVGVEASRKLKMVLTVKLPTATGSNLNWSTYMSNIPGAPPQDFDVGALYNGAYLKASDLNGQTFTAVIGAVEPVEIPEPDGSMRKKAAVTLQGWPMKLLLNRTNFEAIAAGYGRRSAGWSGKPIEIFPDTVAFNGRSVACTRVRVPRPAAPGAALPGIPGAAAPAAALPGQASMLPPIATVAVLTDDIPY